MASDSDEDELIKCLDVFGHGFDTDTNVCWFCDSSGATVRCSMCGLAYYCDIVRVDSSFLFLLRFYYCNRIVYEGILLNIALHVYPVCSLLYR